MPDEIRHDISDSIYVVCDVDYIAIVKHLALYKFQYVIPHEHIPIKAVEIPNSDIDSLINVLVGIKNGNL